MAGMFIIMIGWRYIFTQITHPGPSQEFGKYFRVINGAIYAQFAQLNSYSDGIWCGFKVVTIKLPDGVAWPANNMYSGDQ